ncbi:MAG: tetratricopeptide repeat protein [Terriglobales bacterium]
MPNLYTLTINEQDYAPVYERIPLSPSSMPLRMLHISLVPKEEIAKPKADAETERIPGSNPNVVDPAGLTRELPQLAIREFKAGIASEHKNDIEEAIRHYQKAIEIAPEFYEARNNLGSLHLGRSEFEAARQQFQEAMRLNPAEARAHFNMANLMLITHQPVKAQSIARDGLRLQPSSAFGHFVLGSALERSSDMAEAEQELRRALELDPAMAKARLQLVNVYLRQNRKAEAMNELRAFLKAAPDDPLVARAREVLKRLESERASK